MGRPVISAEGVPAGHAAPLTAGVRPRKAFLAPVANAWPWIALALLPLALPYTLTDLMVFAGLYYIAGLGVGLALAQCGIVNLGQALFYGVGAYASAYLTTKGFPILVGVSAGVLVSAALAGGLGWPILRLSGFFLGLATLALGIVGSALFSEWDFITGGSLGIGGIPKPSVLGFALDTPQRYYCLVWGVALVASWATSNLVNGRTGLLLRAARDSADASVSLGLRLRAMRTFMFVICAVLASVSGSLFAHYATFVSVDSFSMWKSLTFLLVPIIGGMRSTGGMLCGALFVTFVPHYLGRVGDIHAMLFGVTMVLIVVLLPNGLASLREVLANRAARTASREDAHG